MNAKNLLPYAIEIESFYAQWRAMIKEFNLKIAYLPPLKQPSALERAIKEQVMVSELHDCLRTAIQDAINNPLTFEEAKQRFQSNFEQSIEENIMAIIEGKFKYLFDTYPLNLVPLNDPHKDATEPIKQCLIDITLTPEKLVKLKKAVSDIKKEMTDLKPR